MISSLRFGDSASGSNSKAKQAKPSFKDGFLYGYKFCDFCNYGPAEANRRARARLREGLGNLLHKDTFTKKGDTAN